MKKPKNRTKTKRTTKRDSISKLDLPLKSYKEKPELIHDNPYQASESIAKALVDKIITISVRKSHNNHLNKIYKNYYFDCMQNQLDILFATNYLYYYDEPENEERNKIFWNKNLEKKNTWVEITEPNSSKIDRYENVFMQFINYNPPHVDNIDNKKSSLMRSSTFNEGNSNKDDLFDSKIQNNASQKFSLKIKDVLNKKGNEILDILEEKSSASSKDEDTNRKKKKITKVRKSIKHPTKTKKKNSISPKRDSLIKSISPKKESSKEKKNSDDEDISKNKKSKRQSILAMNFIEIPNIDKESNNEIYSPPDVEKLRKAVIEGKIKKEKEEKKHALIKKMTSINNVENIFGDDNKMIDSNKLTFDSNGKIISFKPIKIESFNKDFLSLKNGIKSLEINNANNKKSRFKRNKNKNQNEIIQREKSYDKEIIIKNPEDDPEGKNSINYVKMSAIKNEQKIPSGSNFSLMLPNIGVTLREDDQVKEGKKEFGKYFKKYSMNDYDKILHEFLPLQNKTLIKNQLNQAENLTSSSKNMTSVNKKNKYISTNPLGNNLNNFNMTNTTNTPLTQTLNYNTISELPNPLINQQETIQENDINTNNNNSSFIKTNKSMNSYYSGNNIYSGSMSRLYNNMSNFTAPKFIMLNKNCSSTSLKNEIENLKDLNEESNLNIYPSKIKLKSRNIFLDNYKEFYKNKRIKEKTINLIDSRTNELNKKIMINGLWGSQTLQKNKSSGNLLYGKHLTKYQALRELGSNLLTGIKIKLPRDRKVDINL